VQGTDIARISKSTTPDPPLPATHHPLIDPTSFRVQNGSRLSSAATDVAGSFFEWHQRSVERDRLQPRFRPNERLVAPIGTMLVVADKKIAMVRPSLKTVSVPSAR
jgi:hypothetical protein